MRAGFSTRLMYSAAPAKTDEHNVATNYAASSTDQPSMRAIGHCTHHSGLLRFSVNAENIMLKLTLILSSPTMLVSTE